MKIYLDANIFLNAILYDDTKANYCKEILKKVGKKEMDAITATLTWDEVVYIIKKSLGREISKTEGKKFLEFPNLEFKEVNINVISKAQFLLENYDIKPRDAIHAATAIINNVNEIISDDSDFDKIKEIKRIKVI